MHPLSIGVVGGTGPQGKGLGYRLAQAGHTLVLGSRSVDRAHSAAEELRLRVTSTGSVTGATNKKAAEAGDLVLLAVPWDGHADLVAELAKELAGKVVVNCVNPTGFDSGGPHGLSVSDGSAAEQAMRLLPKSSVIGAFHHVSAVKLLSDVPSLGHEDVLVCGDDRDAKHLVTELARAVTGRKGVDVGPLRLAHQLETLTAVLISINKRHKARAGVQIIGIPQEPDRS